MSFFQYVSFRSCSNPLSNTQLGITNTDVEQYDIIAIGSAPCSSSAFDRSRCLGCIQTRAEINPRPMACKDNQSVSRSDGAEGYYLVWSSGLASQIRTGRENRAGLCFTYGQSTR